MVVVPPHVELPRNTVRRVIAVESKKLGGTCVNVGCDDEASGIGTIS